MLTHAKHIYKICHYNCKTCKTMMMPKSAKVYFFSKTSYLDWKLAYSCENISANFAKCTAACILHLHPARIKLKPGLQLPLNCCNRLGFLHSISQSRCSACTPAVIFSYTVGSTKHMMQSDPICLCQNLPGPDDSILWNS